jgi:hypothetical protein
VLRAALQATVAYHGLVHGGVNQSSLLQPSCHKAKANPGVQFCKHAHIPARPGSLEACTETRVSGNQGEAQADQTYEGNINSDINSEITQTTTFAAVEMLKRLAQRKGQDSGTCKSRPALDFLSRLLIIHLMYYL